jgi:predicted dehydrogenase
VSISLRFANGVLGSFMLSDTVAAPRSWEQTTREDPVFAAYPDEDCYIVAGTDGSLAIPTMLLRFYGDPGQRSWHVPFESEILAINHADPLARQLDNFCAVIRGTEEPGVSARDGLQNVRVLEAIRRAAASGQTCVVGN